MPSCIHVCWKCEKRFSTKARFHDHYTVDHSSKAQACSICDKKFPNTLVLDGHTNAHSRNAHSCNICGEFCSTSVDLFIHVTVSHKHGGKYACDLCKSTFLLRRNLKQHLMYEHKSKIVAIEHAAELSCTIHSSRSFPDEDVLLDALIRGDVFQRHLEAELDKGSKCEELGGADKHSDSPKLGAPVSKTSSARSTVIPEQVTAKGIFPIHLNENKSVDNSQSAALMQLPSKQLDLHYPKLNIVIPTHSVTIRNKLSINERNQQTQEYPYFLSSDKFSTDEKLYTCDVCGIKYKDMNSFLESHASSDGYF